MAVRKLHSLSKSELHSHMGHLAVRECEHQAEVIEGEDTLSSQQIVAQELKVEIKEREVARAQANGSVRREITLSKEQEASYQRVRELISHIHPNPIFAEVFEYLAQEFLKRKDPLVAKGRAKKKTTDDHSKEPQGSRQQSSKAQVTKTEDDETTARHRNGQANSESVSEETTHAGRDHDNTEPFAVSGAAPTSAHFQMEQKTSQNSALPQQHWPIARPRSHLSVETVRFVYRRDQSCRWKNESTGEVCGSKFQLQPEHIQSLWAGGSDEPENLQLLCSKHNRLKYRREAGIRWA